MVQIKVKGINQTYHIYASYDDADEFFNSIKERLHICRCASAGYFEAFFHLDILREQDIIRLFQVCEECETHILGINTRNEMKQIQVMEEDLRGGKHYVFHEPTILMGNIHKMAYVISSESLYVFGSVQGSVDLLHEDCTLCTSHLNANIRICDSSFQNMTSFSPCKVYYEQRKIELKKYKEELQWEKL